MLSSRRGLGGCGLLNQALAFVDSPSSSRRDADHCSQVAAGEGLWHREGRSRVGQWSAFGGGLPDSAKKRTRGLIKFEFHINTLFSTSMPHAA